MVWINRGWIPRHFVTSVNDGRADVPLTSTSSASWERPSGIVTLMAMESDTEIPGAFAPPSRLDGGVRGGGGEKRRTHGINRLLWMDRNAMEEMTSSSHDDDDERGPRRTHLFVEIDTTSDDESSSSSSSSSYSSSSSSRPTTFPARASREYVGEFKVTPAIHAGYAFTWFGLSSAGIIMTRKLLSRGR